MNTKKATKRALLTSVMALVMCVVMLVGTTFAWFTDTASTAVNKIQAGNLKVDIVAADEENGEYRSLKGRTLQFLQATGEEGKTTKVADVLWEPGATYFTQGFKIANKGNLALQYKVVVSGIAGDAGLLKVMEFDVVKSVSKTAEKVEFDKVAGHLEPPTGDASVTYSGVYYLRGHMKEEAGNEYQDMTLNGVTVTVYATQYTYEKDSIDDQYDANATYTVTPATAQQALDNAVDGTVIQLTEGNYGTLYFRQSEKSEHLENLDTNDYNNQVHYYQRTLNNVTIIGAEGAVVDSIEFLAGNYAPGDSTVPGNIVDSASWIHSWIDATNVTVQNVAFSGKKTGVDLTSGNLKVDGFTIDGCTMTVSETAGQIKLVSVRGGRDNAYQKNITVKNCYVTGAYQVIDVMGVDGMTVTNNVFTNIGGNNVLLQKDISGDVIITGNTSDGSAGRFVRIGDASGMTLTITGNTIINYNGSDNDYIKVSKCPTSGVTIGRNNATAADSSRTLEVTTEQ